MLRALGVSIRAGLTRLHPNGSSVWLRVCRTDEAHVVDHGKRMEWVFQRHEEKDPEETQDHPHH